MPVQITLPDGTTTRTDHLPFEVIAKVAHEAETNWAHIVEAPHLGDGTAMLTLYKAACKHHGQVIAEDLNASNLPGYFEPCEIDLPDSYEGGIPDPQTPGSSEQGSPATTSSAGSRSTSAGRQRKSGRADTGT